MATFTVRRFSDPDALRAIAPARLLTFLRPFAAYLTGRGLSLADEGTLDYETLSSVLMAPDEDVPERMVDALYFVNEMSQPEAMIQILAAARERELKLDLDDEPTAADVAVAAWLLAPDLLEEMHAETFALRPKSFEYYSGETRRKRAFPEFSPKTLDEMAARLDVWFAEHKRGTGSKMFIFPQSEKAYLVVRHGAPMRREGSLRNGVRGVAYYRPEVHDVLVYDMEMDLLGLKAGSKSEKTLYRAVVGAALFGNAEYFATPFKLTLDPLRAHGPELLRCEDVSGMTDVKLVEIRRFIGGPAKERQINQATDLFQAFGDRWRQKLSFGTLSGATFEVTLGEGRVARRRKVALSPPNFAKYDRDEDAEVIEAWLRSRGLMPKSEQEQETKIAPSVAAILASPGGTPGQGDGAAGLAASAG